VLIANVAIISLFTGRMLF